jgi:glycosyltransferase involved in cell wall biosynthesis
MRFVLVSTHVDQTTGYAKVAYSLLRQLATLVPKVKVYHFGFQRHPSRSSFRKAPEGVITYDAAANEDPKEDGFGFNKIHEYLEMVGPDVVMIYNDPLIIHKFIESMKHERGKSPYKLWLYLDQVYDGIAKPLVDTMNSHADRIYTFSSKWRETYLSYESFPDVRVMEHAVDPTMFTSMPRDARLAVRKNMSVPDDALVFLNANRNSQRKRLDLTVMGFVRLLKERRDAPYYLLLATNLNPQTGAYYDIQRIYMSEVVRNGLSINEVASRLVLVDTSPPNVLGDDAINQIYNASDIGVNTSDGEGFGLCQLEHMYTGAPQVVTGVGTYNTFLPITVATFIEPVDRSYFAGAMPLGSHTPTFSTGDVADAMKKCVDELSTRRSAVNAYTFKSWASVCDEFLEDVLVKTET